MSEEEGQEVAVDDPEGVLAAGTLAVFALVAAADGTVDAEEVRAFVAGIYQTVRMAGSALGSLVEMGAKALGRRTEVQSLERSRPGSGVQAVANALWGDVLEGQGSNLRIEMGFLY